MGLEAHACSLRILVTLHVSGAIHWPWYESAIKGVATDSKSPNFSLILYVCGCYKM